MFTLTQLGTNLPELIRKYEKFKTVNLVEIMFLITLNGLHYANTFLKRCGAILLNNTLICFKKARY